MTPETTRPALRRAAPLWLRIGLTVLLGYLAATLAGGLFLASRLDTAAAEARRARLHEQLESLTPLVRDSLLADETATLRATAAQVATFDDLRLTIMRPDGEVVAESERPLPLPNHADRPEVIQAMATGVGSRERESSTIGEGLLYVAHRVDAADGEPLGVLRVALPLRARDQARNELNALLLLAFLTGIPVASLVAWLAARRIARPLEEMSAAATRMAGGDFTTLPRGEHDDEAGRLAESLRRMGTSLSDMLRISESDRAELATIVASMTEGVLAVDENEHVLRANRGVARALELPELPQPGTALSSFVTLPALTEIVRAALAGDPPPVQDVDIAGATARVVNVSAATIRGASARAVGAVVVLRDVTELRRLERARLDFVANVSHELRTPVAAVLGALETVQTIDESDEDDPEARLRFFDSAFRNAHRLSSIVTDLLALSSIETEAPSMERWPVPLLRSIRSAAGSLAADAQRAGVTLVLPDPESREIEVLGHESRMELVWVNLLSNALKYTPKGGRVDVSVVVDQEAGQARVTIADTGPGIPDDALPRIFERFYRVDKARSRDRGGTGLGLAIVKHIVRAHRGTVTVQSRVGEGSSFQVTLPLGVDPADGSPD